MTTTLALLLAWATSPEGVALLAAGWVGLMSAASGLCQRLGWVTASKITAGLAGLDVGGLMRHLDRARRAKVLP